MAAGYVLLLGAFKRAWGHESHEKNKVRAVSGKLMPLCPALTASAAYLPPANRPFTLRDKDWEMPAQDRVRILRLLT